MAQLSKVLKVVCWAGSVPEAKATLSTPPPPPHSPLVLRVSYTLSLICQPDIRGHEAPHHHYRERPFSPSVPAEAGCLFNCCGRCSCVHLSGKPYRHCFLVGWCTNKSYVIATSDLWLFIHASNLLPLNSPSPLPYKSWRLRAGSEVEES